MRGVGSWASDIIPEIVQFTSQREPTRPRVVQIRAEGSPGGEIGRTCGVTKPVG